MEQKAILDRFEFDNETYEVTGRTRSADATTMPAPCFGELQLALSGAIASRERGAAPHIQRGRLPDDLAGLGEAGALVTHARQQLH